MTNTQREWEEELQFSILEEYIECAKNGYPDRSREEWLEEMRSHFEKLKSFIRTEIEAAEKRERVSQKELLESLVLMYEQYCQDGHAFMTAGEAASSTLEDHGYRFDEVGRIIATPTNTV